MEKKEGWLVVAKQLTEEKKGKGGLVEKNKNVCSSNYQIL